MILRLNLLIPAFKPFPVHVCLRIEEMKSKLRLGVRTRLQISRREVAWHSLFLTERQKLTS